MAACGDSSSRTVDCSSLYMQECMSTDDAQAAKTQPKARTHIVRRGEPVMTPFPYTSLNDAPWKEIFNDSNKYQYAYAEKLGIDPISDLGHAYYLKHELVKIEPNANYGLDTLTHSVPYLVPEAAKLLSDIGAGFNSRLKARGIHGWRIKVTSLLRTAQTVRSLRRINRNATDSSTHKFATTFDISYASFINSPRATPADPQFLKEVLAQTIFDLRRQERCMVKYERHSPCFHITVTK